jgi:hypothetical protein
MYARLTGLLQFGQVGPDVVPLRLIPAVITLEDRDDVLVGELRICPSVKLFDLMTECRLPPEADLRRVKRAVASILQEFEVRYALDPVDPFTQVQDAVERHITALTVSFPGDVVVVGVQIHPSLLEPLLVE